MDCSVVIGIKTAYDNKIRTFHSEDVANDLPDLLPKLRSYMFSHLQTPNANFDSLRIQQLEHELEQYRKRMELLENTNQALSDIEQQLRTVGPDGTEL